MDTIKLQCYIALVWKGFPVTNTLAYWTYSLHSVVSATPGKEQGLSMHIPKFPLLNIAVNGGI
jgi:hypothetical protein